MSRSCKECAHHNPDFIDEVCLHCSWPEFAGEPSNFKPKPITNADRIRAMTDEELAKWMAYKVECQYCSVRSAWCTESEASCRTNWLDWLEKEATQNE